jgi:hypothetical protein
MRDEPLVWSVWMKGMTSCCAPWLIALALVLSSAACTSRASESTAGSDEVPRGEYHGELWSNAMHEAVTEFYGETRNGRDGVYRFGTGDAQEEGVLFNCKRLAGLEFRCSWKDGWGLGQLDLKFTEDFGAFTGVWSDESNPPSLSLRWHGRRQSRAHE